MKNVLIWLALIVLLLILPPLIGKIHNANYSEKDFTSFYQEMTAKKIKSARITDQDLEWDDLSGKKFKTTIPAEGSYEIGKELRDNGATVKNERRASTMFGSLGIGELLIILPLTLIIYVIPITLAVWIFITLRRMDKRVKQIERLLLNRG